jgi:hypothetical protein
VPQSHLRRFAGDTRRPGVWCYSKSTGKGTCPRANLAVQLDREAQLALTIADELRRRLRSDDVVPALRRRRVADG